MKIIEEDKTIIISKPETYTLQNKAAGMLKMQNQRFKRRKMQDTICSDKQPERHDAYTRIIGR